MRVIKDQVTVRVPATSANLGPGFDSCGLALSLYDTVRVRATTGPTSVTISGYGIHTLPTDDSHLVVQTLRQALDYVGAPQVGIEMWCDNQIPQARGLGSSAGAIVAGMWIARCLIDEPEALDADKIFEMATKLEGHPDNVAPAVYGGYTISWIDQDAPRTLRLNTHPELVATAFVPRAELSTEVARKLLPERVDFSQAVFNSSRSALLTAALTQYPQALYPATADQLHQDNRRPAMPASVGLVDFLRSYELPAIISGAGPTVLCFGQIPAQILRRAKESGWKVLPLRVSHAGVEEVDDEANGGVKA